MADEPTVQDPNTPVVDDTEGTTPPAEPAAEDRVAQLEAKIQDYESKFLSTEYADYLRYRAGMMQPQQPQQPAQPQRKQWTTEERQQFEERLAGLSRAEFAAYIRDAVTQDIEQRVVKPLAQEVVQTRVLQDIENTSKKYSDFNDYRQDMINISNANPALGAEQVYLLAKAQRSGTTPQRTAPVRKQGGELPGGSPAGPKVPKGKEVTFEQGFDDAFKKANLKP
jgi:hypothetical protein